MKLSVLSLTMISVAQATSNNAFVERYQRRAELAGESLKALLTQAKDMTHRSLQFQSAVNCNHESVNEWVFDNVQGGSCQDFATVIGGVEACQAYESFQDPAECLELNQESTFNIGTGESGPNEVEQCLFFVNHLMPHPYFLDLDSILPIFGSGFDFPTYHECRASDTQCEVTIQYEEQAMDETMPSNMTAAPTSAPYTETVPCTRCDFFYDSDAICFDADCNIFNCASEIDVGEEVDVLSERNLNETIKVCFRNSRSDLFSFTEYRMGDYFGCSVDTEEKSWTTIFDVGVTNINKIAFRMGNRMETDEDGGKDMGLNFCEVSVDEVLCKGCVFCGVNDTNPHIAVDCENILQGAMTSCDSELDFEYGIGAKLISLQAGYSRAPTNSPTVFQLTSAPTNTSITGSTPEKMDNNESVELPEETEPETPTASDAGDETPANPGFAGGMDGEQIEGAAVHSASGAARFFDSITIVVFMLVLVVF